MDGATRVPTAVIPTGGPREIPVEVGQLFLHQIELWTLRTGTEILHVGQQGDAMFARLTPAQRQTAHAIALSLVSRFRGD